MKLSRAVVRDTILRVVNTFWQAASAVLIGAGAGYYKASIVRAAAIAGGAAVLSLVHNTAANLLAQASSSSTNASPGPTGPIVPPPTPVAQP